MSPVATANHESMTDTQKLERSRSISLERSSHHKGRNEKKQRRDPQKQPENK